MISGPHRHRIVRESFDDITFSEYPNVKNKATGRLVGRWSAARRGLSLVSLITC